MNCHNRIRQLVGEFLDVMPSAKGFRSAESVQGSCTNYDAYLERIIRSTRYKILMNTGRLQEIKQNGQDAPSSQKVYFQAWDLHDLSVYHNISTCVGTSFLFKREVLCNVKVR